MNGTPSERGPDGIHPGNASDDRNAAGLTDEQRLRAEVAEAEAILFQACQGGDCDLSQAFEILHQWLARTPEGAPVR